MTTAERIHEAIAGLVPDSVFAFIEGPDPENPIADVPVASMEFAELVARAMGPERVYIVTAPGWESEFDSAWSTEELAQKRADVLDPTPDNDGIRWGIIGWVQLDGDPEADGTEGEGPAYVNTVERPGNADALARLAAR